jgi:hypothetical protein
MGEFMKLKMVSEDKKANAMERKLDLDAAEFELEKKRAEVDTQQAKVEMARMAFPMDGVDPQVHKAANEYLLTLFI